MYINGRLKELETIVLTYNEIQQAVLEIGRATVAFDNEDASLPLQFSSRWHVKLAWLGSLFSTYL